MSTLPSVTDAAYPAPSEILNTLLASIRYANAKDGLVANVKPGSDHYIRADAYAKRVSIAIANGKLAKADYSPLTATGQALIDLCDLFGIKARPASKSAGGLIVATVGNATVTIPQGFQCTAPNGFRYTVQTATPVTTGSTVDVISVEAGEDTEQDAGTVLTWDSAAIGALIQTATADSSGIAGGANADDEETLRTRLLNRLAFPATGGNFAQVIEKAEQASASVQVAFCYQAVQGPGSVDVAIMRDDGDRTLASTIVNSVASRVLGEMPGHAQYNFTTVNPQPLDVVLGVTLPLPLAAGGAGNGFRDGTPWPTTVLGPSPSLTGTPDLTFTSSTPGTITRSTGSWYQDLLLPGMTITIINTVSNNGTKTIQSMTSTVITTTEATVAEVVVAIAPGSVTSTTALPTRVVSKALNIIRVSASSTNAPYAGAQFGLWDSTSESMKEFTIASVGGSAGAYLVTIDTTKSAPLSFIADGDVASGGYVSAGAKNLKGYATDFLSAIRSMGPGEKSTNPDIVPRGRRRVGPEIKWPNALTATQFANIVTTRREVVDLQYAARLGAGTSTTVAAASVTAAPADAPRCLTLSNVAFQKI